MDFDFIELARLAAIAKTAKDGQAAPKGLDGTLVTRAAMGVDVLARLHRQIQQVLGGVRDGTRLVQKTKVEGKSECIIDAESWLFGGC